MIGFHFFGVSAFQPAAKMDQIQTRFRPDSVQIQSKGEISC